MVTVNTTVPTRDDVIAQTYRKSDTSNKNDRISSATFIHKTMMLQDEKEDTDTEKLRKEKEKLLQNALQNHLCRDVMNLLDGQDHGTTKSCSSSTVILSDAIAVLKEILQKISEGIEDKEDSWNKHITRKNNVIPQKNVPTVVVNDNNDENVRSQEEFCQLVIHVANQWFCQPNIKITSKKTRSQKRGKKTWKSLQIKAEYLLQPLPNKNRNANVLIISFLFGYFSLLSYDYQEVSGVDIDDAKAAASAIATTLKSKVNGKQRYTDSLDFWKFEEIDLATMIFSTSLRYAAQLNPPHCGKEYRSEMEDTLLEMNLNIITYFARAFDITSEAGIYHIQALQNENQGEEENVRTSNIGNINHGNNMGQYSANAIIKILSFANNCNNSDDIDFLQHVATGKDEDQLQKQRVSGALALACQVYPWPSVSPVQLVKVSVPFKYYVVAENICSLSSKSSQKEVKVQSVTAVELLIDTVMECKLYRIADKLSTNLYDVGGKSRFVEARYHHACSTIGKVILSRQYNLIDRLVDRVDRALTKELNSGTEERRMNLNNHKNRSQDIRNFTVHKLQQAGEIETLYRLVDLWNMDRELLEEHALQAAIQARREKYIQYEDIPFIIAKDDCKEDNKQYESIEPPDLISDPDQLLELRSSFFSPPLSFDKKSQLIDNVNHNDVNGGKMIYHLFGMDAEWDEETDGVTVLQISNIYEVILLDMKALSCTKEGQKALEFTVGALLDSIDSNNKVIGFSCGQDIARLRVSIPKLKGFRAVVDLQTMLPWDLKKYGLSRISKHYLGKPLDKAEQCSFWSSRPLTKAQRAYAALDAWVCIAIYEKITNAKSLLYQSSK